MSKKTTEEKAEYLYEVNKREAERAHDNLRDFANKLNEAAVGNANLALRSGVLINGGAYRIVRPKPDAGPSPFSAG